MRAALQEGEQMKMDLRRVLPLLFLFAITACGKQKIASETFQKPQGGECESDVAPNQYIIRYHDGSIKVVQAPSKEEFFEKFVDPEIAKIDYTEPDYVVQYSTPAVFTPAPTPNNWGVVRVGADALWSAPEQVRGAGVIVAVIDSGVDINHTQLQANIAVNAGEQGTDSMGRNKETNGVDDDGNGFIDDVRGWNFVANKPLVGDNFYHGTHVAGIIAAAHSDTTAGPANHVQGMAPSAKILPVAFLNNKGSGMMSDGVKAINYAVARGARVINASWGGPVCSKSLRDSVAALESKNVIFVAAAGNGDEYGDGYDIDLLRDFPASFNFPTQFTVGASGTYDLATSFSNYGRINVHIFAPGYKIVSTVPGNGIEELDGTSMAAPMVAGAIALLLSAEPTATVAQVRQALYSSAHKSTDLQCASLGRLELRGALAELRRQMGP